MKAYASNGTTTPIPTDGRENNEILKKLSMQLAEKDNIIRSLQSQLDESKATKARRDTHQSVENNKGGSAGPSVKGELSKIKKQLREKEKEIVRMRNEQTA